MGVPRICLACGVVAVVGARQRARHATARASLGSPLHRTVVTLGMPHPHVGRALGASAATMRRMSPSQCACLFLIKWMSSPARARTPSSGSVHRAGSSLRLRQSRPPHQHRHPVRLFHLIFTTDATTSTRRLITSRVAGTAGAAATCMRSAASSVLARSLPCAFPSRATRRRECRA